jgi:hypothetical protein
MLPRHGASAWTRLHARERGKAPLGLELYDSMLRSGVAVLATERKKNHANTCMHYSYYLKAVLKTRVPAGPLRASLEQGKAAHCMLAAHAGISTTALLKHEFSLFQSFLACYFAFF